MFQYPRHFVIFLWILFLIVWVLAAFKASRTVRRESFASSLPYRLALLLCVLLLFSRAAALGWLALRVVPDTVLAGWIGVAITLLGVTVAIVARLFLGRNWSSSVTIAKDHKLILAGPYSIVRHPIYSGILLGSGVAVGEARGMIVLVLGALGFRFKFLKEEQFMEEEVSDQYRDYKQRVKALVPLVW
jgi:protein-S-isoprenylcysteine O-methyltransferase Ste14